MVESLIPYEYQQRDIDFLVAYGAGIIATQVGGGKTLVSIEAAKALDAQDVLVIAPKGTHKRAWQKTIERQIPGAIVRQINSTQAGKDAYADLYHRKPGWYLITPEFFRKFRWDKIHPDVAIFDEIHRASNRKSQTAKMLHTLKAVHRFGLSGTIAGNKIEGFWSVVRWVFPDFAGRSFWAWADHYCLIKEDYFAGKIIVGEKEPGSIVAHLPAYIRHLKRERCCDLHPDGMDADLPPIVSKERSVDLAPEQKKIYKQMEKDLVAWLNGNPMIAEVPVSARIRLRQITLGVPSIDPDTNEIFFAEDCKSSKLDELFNIISDHPDGEQMLILTHSQKFARVATKRLEGAGYSAFEWSGTATQKDRDAALERFIAGDIQFIVAVIAAIGEGTDGLQEAASVVVWLSKDDNRLLNEQAAGRLDRRGQKKSVVSYEIIADGTYDENQLSKLVRDQLAMNQSLRKQADDN